MSEPIYHLALRADWDAAVEKGTYEISTIGQTLAEVGFIHCSSASQWRAIADAFYTGRDDVLLLKIDVDRVGAEIKVEHAGGDELFPHIYGPLPVDAVVRCERLES